MLRVLVLLMLGACASEPRRDEHGCWSDDREIWLALWDEWCTTMDACGSMAQLSPYPDLAACRADARARLGSYEATCLNGCEMDACLADIEAYRERCDLSDLASTPPAFCEVVLGSQNPYTECIP